MRYGTARRKRASGRHLGQLPLAQPRLGGGCTALVDSGRIQPHVRTMLQADLDPGVMPAFAAPGFSGTVPAPPVILSDPGTAVLDCREEDSHDHCAVHGLGSPEREARFLA
ncbi:hypothetical protein GCM10009753_45820 [Streptantibioticus ferralitis]